MQPTVKARYYANAFLELSEKQGAMVEMVNSLENFYKVYKSEKSLKSLLISRRISEVSKQEILQKGFSESMHPAALKFVSFLSSEKAVKLLPQIIRNLKREYKKRKNIVDVHLISANIIDEKVLNDLRLIIKQREGKTAVISTEIEEQLIGGVKLRIGNTVVDGSAANKLNQLKKTLLNRSN